MTAPPPDDAARRWRRVEDICDAALKLGASQRDAYLASACGADQALRGEVEALLVHEKTSDEFLSAPIGAVAAQVLEPPRNLIGTRIADYDVVAKLGEGGMGEVYRARDRTLGRDVAIKLLPAAVANDQERLKRFEREARLLASVNHPSIGAIYGVAEAGGLRALVLELIEGETLAAVLERGPIKLDRALAIAAQICDALDHAHRRGVTHRDLKPSNVMLVEGRVKVLDFGVGKSASPVYGAAVSRESTLTNDGAIVGTLHYMSPEQLEGRATDARSDIFSFGAVLYEMLSGRKAFDGPSQASIIAAVMEAPTPKLVGIASPLAPRLERVVSKCLAKSADDRWQSARDLADELRWLGSETSVAPATGMRVPTRRPIIAILAGAAALVAMALIGWAADWRGNDADPGASPISFSVQPVLVRSNNGNFAISPDGGKLVYATGVAGLVVRRLDRFETFALPDSTMPGGVNFSPDGAWVAFYRGGELRKTRAGAEGAPVVLLDNLRDIFQVEWPAADTILLAATGHPILRLSANGGRAEAITTIESSTEEDHHGPHLLPSGNALLFAVHGKRNRFSIAVQDLRTGARKALVESGFAPIYSPTGHLLFGRGSSIMAVPFDERRLELRGEPITLIENVSTAPASGGARYRLSKSGTLVYQPTRPSDGRMLTWVDRNGRETPVGVPARAFGAPSVSPDGKHLAFVIDEHDRRDVWTYELASGKLARLTRDGDTDYPIWSHDGAAVLYGRSGGARSQVVLQPLNGDGLEIVASSDDDLWPTSLTPGGQIILTVQPPTDEYSLARVTRGSPELETVLTNKGLPRFSRLSPDGRWLAYTETVDNRSEVIVQSYPDPGVRRQISVDGGAQPIWRRDGNELFFRSRGRLLAAPIDTSSGLNWGRPKLLFELDWLAADLEYDIAPDGRFLMIKADPAERASDRLNVIVNWRTELLARMPVPR